jgi:hypothetical protein
MRKHGHSSAVTRRHGNGEGAEGDNMTRAEGMLDAFDRVGWGALLIGAQGRVISFNTEAGWHVGSVITIVQGQIAATHRRANAN